MTDNGRLFAIVDEQVPWPVPSTDAETFTARVLTAAAEQLDVAGEVSVLYVNDEAIHELNRTYRGVDRPTDVLSFAMLEGDEAFPELEDSLDMLGDVVVSVDTAKRQAEEYDHSLERELAFLLVHGFLHLNGYDHEDEAAEREMFGLQETILASIGLPRVNTH